MVKVVFAEMHVRKGFELNSGAQDCKKFGAPEFYTSTLISFDIIWRENIKKASKTDVLLAFLP